MSKAPQSPVKPNNTPEPSMAYRYERAYQSKLKEKPEGLQKRILAAKGNAGQRDPEIDQFVTEVVTLAESEQEL